VTVHRKLGLGSVTQHSENLTLEVQYIKNSCVQQILMFEKWL